MRVTVRHVLTLPVGTPPRSVAHLLLTPSATPQQKVEHWSIEMPGIEGAASFRDGFGNRAHLVTQVKPEGELTIVVSGRVETIDKAGILGRLDYDPVPAVFRRSTATTRPDPEFLEDLPQDEGRIGMLHELMSRIHEAPAGQSQSQTQDGHEQSQEIGGADGVHAFIGGARALGIPSRFVRGYVLDDGKAAIHHWAEAWDDGLGWIGFDPRLNVCPTTDHIRIACGLDAASAPAVRIVPALAGEPVESIEIADQVPST